MPDVALLDAKIAEAERAIAEGETTGEKRRAMERREDLMRLKRVEQIYVRTLHPERGVVPCLAAHQTPADTLATYFFDTFPRLLARFLRRPPSDEMRTPRPSGDLGFVVDPPL